MAKVRIFYDESAIFKAFIERSLEYARKEQMLDGGLGHFEYILKAEQYLEALNSGDEIVFNLEIENAE